MAKAFVKDMEIAHLQPNTDFHGRCPGRGLSEAWARLPKEQLQETH